MNDLERKRNEASEQRAKELEKARLARAERMKIAMEKKAGEIQLRHRGVSDRELRNQKIREDAERRNRERELMTDASDQVREGTEALQKSKHESFRKKQAEQLQIIKKRNDANGTKTIHGVEATVVAGGIALGYLLNKVFNDSRRIKETMKKPKDTES